MLGGFNVGSSASGALPGGQRGHVVSMRQVAAALRSGWWIVAISAIVGVASAALYSFLASPKYTAETRLFVTTTDTSTTAAAFQGSQFTQQRVTSYAQLLDGVDLARRVVAQLGLQESPGDLVGEISAQAVPDTVLLDVSVTDPNPRRAMDIASAVGTQFGLLVNQLETPATGGGPLVKVTVVQQPQLPTAPSSPHTTRNVILGLVVGLLIGGAVAVARARLDRSVREADDVLAVTGVPVIGTVMRDSSLDKVHVVDASTPSRTLEDFRQLRANLQFLNVDAPPRVIMVSSALPSEGKTTLAVNLALALVQAGHVVTLLEADLRKPKVSRYLRLVGDVGLTNILSGNAGIEEVTQKSTGLSVIAAGPTPPNPGELLASSQMGSVLQKLRESSDFVLVDAPPLLPVADSSGLAMHTDGVLLSVRYGATRRDHLRQAAVTLERVGATTLGVVLNIVPPKAESAAAYGYGYDYTGGGSGSGTGQHRSVD